MKTTFLNIALAIALVAGVSSCKENKETETAEILEAAEATDSAVTYLVDTKASIITWEGSKPTGTHHGTVDVNSGTFAFNNGELEAGQFTIDMNSITDLDLEGEYKTNLEAHLKGTVEGKEGDFFNVREYPTAAFELTDVTEKDGKVIVSGNLTIKDQTHGIEFPATITENGSSYTIKSETFVLDRTKWGVNYGSKTVFDNLGDKFVDDEIKMTVTIVANKT